MAIIYYIVYDNIYMERAVVTIYNNHTDLWGVSEEELYSLAVVNTPRLYKAEIKPLNEVVYDMILKEEEEKNEIDDLLRHVKKMNDIFPMYVLTNHMKNCGAVCMLYENVLERFSDYIESDVFIIPSSIHEVILVPMDGKVAFESLVEMVKSVNEEVAKEEILSDNVYVYLRNKGFR